jgi:hypothetical protein
VRGPSRWERPYHLQLLLVGGHVSGDTSDLAVAFGSFPVITGDVRKVPLTRQQLLRRTIEILVLHESCQFLDLRLCIFVVTKCEPVGEVSRCHEDIDVGERFEQTIDDLLVCLDVEQGLGIAGSSLCCTQPDRLGSLFGHHVQLFVSLHAWLVESPVDGSPWFRHHLVDDRLRGTCSAGASITSELAMSHQLGMDGPPVSELECGETNTKWTDAVCHDGCSSLVAHIFPFLMA